MNIGHNTDAGKRLLTIIERIERVREDKAEVAVEEKGIFAEAKGAGYDAPTIRKVLKIRATDRAKYQEAQALLDLYLHAIGFEDVPLFKASGAVLPVDEKIRKSLAKSLKDLIPAGVASVTIDTGGASLRLQRDEAGELQVFEGAGV